VPLISVALRRITPKLHRIGEQAHYLGVRGFQTPRRGVAGQSPAEGVGRDLGPAAGVRLAPQVCDFPFPHGPAFLVSAFSDRIAI
jgi:hypothetical protein